MVCEWSFLICSQFASLDENILRFDIQRQFDRIQRAYNQQGTSDEVNVHQRRRRHVVTAPVRHIPAKATEGSRYSIAGLSPERQVSLVNSKKFEAYH